MNVTFDDEDNIYVSARDNKAIYKFTPSGTKTTFATLNVSPNYIVFDKNKNMIVGTSNGYVLITTKQSVQMARKKQLQETE